MGFVYRAWPDRQRRQEFVEMVRSIRPEAYACFEYHDGDSPLTAKGLEAAIGYLANSMPLFMFAVDLEHSVVIASGAFSIMSDMTASKIVEDGLEDFFLALTRKFPDRVAMVIIDRKGGVTVDPAFQRGVPTS